MFSRDIGVLHRNAINPAHVLKSHHPVRRDQSLDPGLPYPNPDGPRTPNGWDQST